MGGTLQKDEKTAQADELLVRLSKGLDVNYFKTGQIREYRVLEWYSPLCVR
jgi:hypothetical protein